MTKFHENLSWSFSVFYCTNSSIDYKKSYICLAEQKYDFQPFSLINKRRGKQVKCRLNGMKICFGVFHITTVQTQMFKKNQI
jgi:hypothetical protein